jgi:branched-chain amino acid transport system substrate-binding protein
MTHVPASTQLGRRRFLKQIGLACTIAATGAVAHATPAAAQRSSIRIGVVVPNNAHAEALLAGLRLGFARRDQPVELEVEYYQSPGQSLAALQKLVESADLLIGMVSRNHVGAINPLLEQHATPLIVCDAGANAVSVGVEGEYILRSSLNHWQSTLALGSWAARSLGRTAAITSSFYDSGYDTLSAFHSGFQSAGGTVLHTNVTHAPIGTQDPATLLASIAASPPDVLFASYSGSSGAEFVRAYAESPLAGRVPLLGSSFLVDDAQLKELGSAAVGIYTAHTYAPDSRRIRRVALSSPSPFTALGFDTALLVAKALANSDLAELPAALRRTIVTGSRGPLSVDPQSREVLAPIYLRQVQQGRHGIQHALVGRLGRALARDARMAASSIAERSGWTNAYLSI